MPAAESDQSRWRRKPFASFTCRSKTESQAVGGHRNSNVMNILPLTTLRTIDLEGKKNSGPLFSRFCVNFESFF
jgi:hypothetical protein